MSVPEHLSWEHQSVESIHLSQKERQRTLARLHGAGYALYRMRCVRRRVKGADLSEAGAFGNSKLL